MGHEKKNEKVNKNCFEFAHKFARKSFSCQRDNARDSWVSIEPIDDNDRTIESKTE